eukprot:SM000051S17611  [mRNA]  locus=s51:614887:615375:+ [translate_table: standard]
MEEVVMEVAAEDGEVVEGGTQEEMVEVEVVEMGRRVEVMEEEMVEAEVIEMGRVVEVMEVEEDLEVVDLAEKGLEAVERETEEEIVEDDDVEVRSGAEVMEVAEED